MLPPPLPPSPPTIRALSVLECREVLERHHVGRIAFSLHDRVDIQPIHYVYDSNWIYGRTSDGSKLLALAHNPWVAFEVDEVRAIFDWQSVVARGTFHRLDHNGPARELISAVRAVTLLRALVPATLTVDDPVPFRDVFFRVSVDQVSGCAASPGVVP